MVAVVTAWLWSGCSTDPCHQAAVMSCIDPDGFSCHEWYSADAAARVPTCIALGDAISDEPCPVEYDVCCHHPDGSFDDPEMLCIRSTAPEAPEWESDCRAMPNWTWCE